MDSLGAPEAVQVQVYRSGSDAFFVSGSASLPIGFACCMEQPAP